MKTYNYTVIQCPKCNDILLSRARHDWNSCSCGNCFVDGGRHYSRLGWVDEIPRKSSLIVGPETEEILYKDWNYRKNKYQKLKVKLVIPKPHNPKLKNGEKTFAMICFYIGDTKFQLTGKARKWGKSFLKNSFELE